MKFDANSAQARRKIRGSPHAHLKAQAPPTESVLLQVDGAAAQLLPAQAAAFSWNMCLIV